MKPRTHSARVADAAADDRRKSEAKARWREESVRRHLAKTLEERLRVSLAMVLPRGRTYGGR